MKSFSEEIREILNDVWKRAIIGYPPTDKLNKERTFSEAVTAILKAIEERVPKNNLDIENNNEWFCNGWNQAIAQIKKELEI